MLGLELGVERSPKHRVPMQPVLVCDTVTSTYITPAVALSNNAI